MKDNKIIKDLKERNDKLKMQYDFNNIHLISLENKYANLQTENTKLKQVISRAIELTNEILSQGWDYYEKDKIAYKLLDILELGE